MTPESESRRCSSQVRYTSYYLVSPVYLSFLSLSLSLYVYIRYKTDVVKSSLVVRARLERRVLRRLLALAMRLQRR